MKPVSLQLWSIKDEVANDFRLTVSSLAKMGYEGVEFAGFHDISAKEMKKILSDNQLKATGSHNSIDDFSNRLESILEYLAEIDCHNLSLAWSPAKTKDDVLYVADLLQSSVEKANQYNVTVSYHNHDQEFAIFDGEYGLDILYQNAPDVKMECDVYWVYRAGLDPVSYLEKYKGRVPLVHMKDADKAMRQTIEVGEGVLDFKKIAQKAEDCGVQEFVIELEHYQKTPMWGVEKSIVNLRKILEG